VRPDFVFPACRVAIFIDGCFWHGCPIHATSPSTNRRFWREKLDGNYKRDRRVTLELRRKQWIVLRFWEHEMQDGERLMSRLRKACLTKIVI
jgi:DNA mismatch endonuclease (patch repair protein)